MWTFNIIISGVGGQGLITLLRLISQAALDSGYDVKTSELHGLSQRGGSVSVHIRFGQKVYSPIVSQGKADLILALEHQEALAGAEFASKNSTFLINKYQTPTLGETASEEQVERNLNKITKKVIFIPAADICQKEFNTIVTAGIFLLGYASFRGLIPLEASAIIKAIKKTMPQKYWDLNIKTFNLAREYKVLDVACPTIIK